MSAESDLRAALIAYAPLLALVPAARISIDTVDATLQRPYIAFSKQTGTRDLALTSLALATTDTVDLLCVGETRLQSIAVADLVRSALAAIGQPSDRGAAAYDADNDLEVEIVTTDWIAV